MKLRGPSPLDQYFIYQSVGFRPQKKKQQQMLLPQNGDTRGGPPPYTSCFEQNHDSDCKEGHQILKN